MLVELLGLAFAPPSDSQSPAGSLLPTAIEAVNITDAINTELTRRGVLPPFIPVT